MTKQEYEKWKEEEEKRLAEEEKLNEEDDEIMVEIDPVAARKAEHYKTKGNNHFKSNELEEALNSYKESLKYQPNNPVVFTNIATVLIKMEKWDEAIQYANKSIVLTEGKNTKAWFKYLFF